MLAFAWALIIFFGCIFLIAQIVFISKGQNSFADLFPWLILDFFIILFGFLTFRTDRISLAVYPTHIKIGRSKIEWFKIKEVLIYKSSKRIIVSNHIMSQREISLINFAYRGPWGIMILFGISILGFTIGVKSVELLGSKKEFEEILPLIAYYCETFKIKLTECE